MKTSMLKLTLPAALLCFAGTALANPVAGTTMAQSHDTAMAGKSRSANPLGQKVQEKLKADKRLHNTKIETDVTDRGAVLLRGTVSTRAQSRLAEQLAATVSGVSKVQNELRVPRGE